MTANPVTPPSSYVTLGVGEDRFAVGVQTVREILDNSRPMAHLPNAPAFLQGVIDVRGCMVPVVDLCLKLGLPASTPTDDTRILVLDFTLVGRVLVVGLLVDRVFEVAEMQTDDLNVVPDIGIHWKSEFIQAIGRLDGRFIVILDLEHLFNSTEIASLKLQ
ncbi:MAG: chemotaxis protein CheW [Magnetococcales bacterium]|nr:chemotaxis protein CheW [Magnetococcales bacterium]